MSNPFVLQVGNTLPNNETKILINKINEVIFHVRMYTHSTPHSNVRMLNGGHVSVSKDLELIILICRYPITNRLSRGGTDEVCYGSNID